MSRKRSNADIFTDLCNSVHRRMFAFECKVDEESGTAELILDSVHRIKLGHLALFPSVTVTYRRDDRRYVLQTEASQGSIRHNAMLVEYERMSEFYNISDMSQLRNVIETVHRNATVCFHKIVRQGNLFIAVFTVPKAHNSIRLNTGALSNLENVSSSWIELHPDNNELRLCVSLIPQEIPRRKRTRDDRSSDSEDHQQEADEDHTRRVRHKPCHNHRVDPNMRLLELPPPASSSPQSSRAFSVSASCCETQQSPKNCRSSWSGLSLLNFRGETPQRHHHPTK